MAGNKVEIPDLEMIYCVSLLVKNGWEKNFHDSMWFHPDKRKIKRRDHDDKEYEDLFWTFDEASQEVRWGDE